MSVEFLSIMKGINCRCRHQAYIISMIISPPWCFLTLLIRCPCLDYPSLGAQPQRSRLVKPTKRRAPLSTCSTCTCPYGGGNFLCRLPVLLYIMCALTLAARAGPRTGWCVRCPLTSVVVPAEIGCRVCVQVRPFHSRIAVCVRSVSPESRIKREGENR